MYYKLLLPYIYKNIKFIKIAQNYVKNYEQKKYKVDFIAFYYIITIQAADNRRVVQNTISGQ